MGHLRVPNALTFKMRLRAKKPVLLKMHLTFIEIKNRFHINGFALRLALKGLGQLGNGMLQATRGARKPNLQVVITHARHVCSKH